MNFMVEPKKGTKWPKELPKFSSRPEAIAICKELCNRQYMHRSEKVAKGELEVRRTPLERNIPRHTAGLAIYRGWTRRKRQHVIESPIEPSMFLLVLFAANIDVKGFLLCGCNWL